MLLFEVVAAVLLFEVAAVLLLAAELDFLDEEEVGGGVVVVVDFLVPLAVVFDVAVFLPGALVLSATIYMEQRERWL